MLADAEVYIPEIVIGELYAGAFWHTYLHQTTKYLDLYDAFRERYSNSLLQCDAVTGHIYGAIYAELKSKGQLIQQNDMWIAALARQHNLTLATLDRDFMRINALAVELFTSAGGR